MYRTLIPEGYRSLSEAARQYGTTENALRLLARRGRIRAVMIRNMIHVCAADYEALYKPRPYPRTASAA